MQTSIIMMIFLMRSALWAVLAGILVFSIVWPAVKASRTGNWYWLGLYVPVMWAILFSFQAVNYLLR